MSICRCCRMRVMSQLRGKMRRFSLWRADVSVQDMVLASLRLRPHTLLLQSLRRRAVSGSCTRLPLSSMTANRSSTLVQRRHNSNGQKATKYSLSSDSDSGVESDNGHHHHHDDHGHSHSLFHSHDDHDHSAGNQMILDTLAGKGDRGGRITLIGLLSNVGLTVGKGIAGWTLNSASLLADAGHSLSDLLGDFVTLFCWKLSRRPPSESYPYGYAKFETMGTTTISLLLIGGALGIGWHSFNLLMDALAPTIAAMPSGVAHDILSALVPSQDAVHAHADAHSHSHGLSLDPNAAWFALAGVLCKEYLFRITRKVAREEHSPVLHANALHHRSDAYTSAVALIAILGSWAVPGLPLDPLGGVVVSVVIVMQSVRILWGALAELTDAGVSQSTVRKLTKVLDGIVADAHASGEGSSTAKLAALSDLRAVRSGSIMFVDVTARVRDDATVRELVAIEDLVSERLVRRKKEVQEVRVRFRAVNP